MRPIALALTLLAAALLGSGSPAEAVTAAGWALPVDGPPVVRRPFQPPPADWRPGHRGVDLAARPGQAVRAAGSGTVTFAAVLAGRGVVTITHGRLRTTYEPVDPVVRVGMAVTAGQVIGTLARGHGSPRPGEALLHWGLRRGQAYLDPMTLVRPAPPRLLPHWGPDDPPPYRPATGAHLPARGDRARRGAGRAAAPEPDPGRDRVAGVAALTAGTAGAVLVRRWAAAPAR